MNIKLRHTEPSDSPALQEMHSRIESFGGTLQLPYPPAGLWRERLERMPPGSLSLVAEVEDRIVGQAGLIAFPNSRRRAHAAHVGLTVHPDWQRKGIGSALMTAIVDAADNWHNYLRLELTVFTDNDAAIALYKKLGFLVEGTHRKFAYRNGEFVDALFMARVR